MQYPFSVGSPLERMPDLRRRRFASLNTLESLLTGADEYESWFTDLNAAKEAAVQRRLQQEEIEKVRRSNGRQTSELLHTVGAGPVGGTYRVITDGLIDYSTFQATRVLTGFLSSYGLDQARKSIRRGDVPPWLGSTISVNLLPLVRTGGGVESWVLARRSAGLGIYRGFVAPFSEGAEACDASLPEAVTRGLREELGVTETMPSMPASLVTTLGPFGCDTGVAVIVRTGMSLHQLDESIRKAHDGREAAELITVPLGGSIGERELTMPWTRRMFNDAAGLMSRYVEPLSRRDVGRPSPALAESF